MPAGPHRLSPWRALAPLTVQIHHPLQGCLELLADGVASMLKFAPGEQPTLPVVPTLKQLLLQRHQLHADLTAGALLFGHGGQITAEVRPAQLPLLERLVVVRREAIAYHNAGKGPQQLHRRGGRAAQALREHRHHRGHHHPLPAAPALGIATIRVAGGGAGFIDAGHRLLAGHLQGFRHGMLQGCAQALANRGVDAVGRRP